MRKVQLKMRTVLWKWEHYNAILYNTFLNGTQQWVIMRHITEYQWKKLKYWFQLLLHHIYFINSLWPTDAIWRHRCGCLTAPSHYLNQCWLLISEVLWHSSESNSTARAQAIILHNELESYILKITFKSLCMGPLCHHCLHREQNIIFARMENSVSWNMFLTITIASCPWHVTH